MGTSKGVVSLINLFHIGNSVKICCNQNLTTSKIILFQIILLTSCISSHCCTALVQRSHLFHRRVVGPSVATLASTSLSMHKSIAEDGTQKNSTKRQSVAIIGGGVAGLSCANVLSKSGIYDPVALFDTGRLRPGGRCSSRFPNDRVSSKHKKNAILSNYVIDHAAQLIAVSPRVRNTAAFQAQLNQWEDQGIIQKFETGAICEIIHEKQTTKLTSGRDLNNSVTKTNSYAIKHQTYHVQPMNQTATTYYYGSTGMGSIPLAMLEQCKSSNVQVHQNVWVSPDGGVQFISTKNGNKNDTLWKIQIQTKQKLLGTFDKLVIAHNGKCADRLMSRSPAKDIHSLLRVVFASTPATRQQKMTLNSIYSLTFCIKKENSPFADLFHRQKCFVSAFIRNHSNLSFLSCQTRKYPALKGEHEVWTVLSSPIFAAKYKAPQENLPHDVVESVTKKLLESLEECLNLSLGCLSSYDTQSIVVESQLQLWGAAVPLNIWTSSVCSASTGINQDTANLGFLYDGLHGVGVCGDWLLDASIAGAWESGRRLAEYMICNTNTTELVGLSGKFQPSDDAIRAGIGSI